MATIPWYCTREEVMSAMDIKLTARDSTRVDRAIADASRRIEKTLHRRFYPEIRTLTLDWPNNQFAQSWRLWLDENELVSATAVVSGGTTLATGSYLLRPDTGPPFTHIEINLGGPAAFSSGDTHQRAIGITGVFGYSADTTSGGALAAAISTVDGTSITVTDSAAIGVGSILLVGAEQMIVTGKRMASTGQTLQTALAAQANATTVAVTNGTAYAYDEVILLDSERMLITDIAGNNLTVRRSWDGSTLATHTGSTVYAPRLLTVERGALGTTAATHDNATPISVHAVPGPVRNLCVAEALTTVQQETAGYARVVGAGESTRQASGRALRELRDEVYATYGRQARIRAV